MKPMILVTTGLGQQRGMDQRQLFQNYADAITAAGGLPVLALSEDEELTGHMDGLFLTGGVDIDPSYYGEEKQEYCGKIDSVRDKEELRLFHSFAEAGKPVLGICRGIQMINVALGGTLYQDQGQECAAPGHENGTIHTVDLLPGSLIDRLFGAPDPEADGKISGRAAEHTEHRIITNSYHHQSIRQLAEDLVISARSGRIIEAVEHKTLPIWAVQWHPERMTGPGRVTAEGPDMAPLFSYFVEACRRQKQAEQKENAQKR